jgi:signal transduction histidine kinase
LQLAADDVTSAFDLDELLGRCIDLMRDVAGTASGSIYLRNDRRGVFQRRVARDVLSEQLTFPILAMEQGFAGKRSVFADLDVDPHPASKAARAGGFRRTLNLPMRWRGHMVGLLVLAYREPVTISESTVRTLEAIIGFQAAAIENARTRGMLELRARLAQWLREFGERAFLVTDRAGLARLILETALRISRTDRGFLARVQRDTATVEFGAGCCERLVGSALDLSIDPYLRKALAEPVLIEDVSQMDPASQLTTAAQRQLTASILLFGERSLGHLLVGSGEPRQWEDEELEAMRLLVNMAAQLDERMRVHAAAEVDRRRLGEAIEHLPIGVAVLSTDGTAIHLNGTARALSEQLKRKDVFRTLDDLIIATPDGQPISMEQSQVARALRGEYPAPYDVVIANRQGTLSMTVRGAAAPLLDANGKVTSVVVGFQDVSELHELAQAKDRFLRIASHELRSPISSLRATSHLIAMDPAAVNDPARRAIMLERLDKQSQRLVTLVEQLIDTTRLHAAEVPLQVADTDLTAICHEAAEAAGRRVRVTAAGPVTGRWDASRLEQVVTNLLSNALRYSPDDSEVLMRVRTDGERAVLEVEDHGIGVPAAQADRLFEPFFRASNANSHRSGLGLGLHITSEIVRRHGGRIRVASTEKVGSTFTVELPL